MPPFLEQSVTIYLLTFLALALSVSLLLSLLINHDMKSDNFKEVFQATLTASLVACAIGILVGLSRDGTVGTVLPAILSVLGGLSIFQLTTKTKEQRTLIAMSVISFFLTLSISTTWSSYWRVMGENQQQLMQQAKDSKSMQDLYMENVVKLKYEYELKELCRKFKDKEKSMECPNMFFFSNTIPAKKR